MNIKPRPKRRNPFWFVLILGILLTNIGTFLFLEFGPHFPYNSWVRLDGPPSGVAQLVGFYTWGPYGLGTLWVKANDGKYYTTKLFAQASSDEGPFLAAYKSNWPIWRPNKNSPIQDIPNKNYDEIKIRGRNCADLQKGLLPLNPAGVRECIYTYFRYGNISAKIYIAFTADGSLKLWYNQLGGLDVVILGVFSVVISFIAAFIIPIIYLIVHLIRRGSVRNQGASPTPD